MASKIKTAYAARLRRHRRVRAKVTGLPERPRLCVFRSLRQVYAQVVDDTTGRTLVSATSLDKETRGNGGARNKTAVAAKVGSVLAQRAREAGITQVVFDRGGFKYHGRVKALANAAREGGLTF